MHVVQKSLGSEVCYWYSHVFGSSLSCVPLWTWDYHCPSLNQDITGLMSYLSPKYMNAWSQTTQNLTSSSSQNHKKSQVSIIHKMFHSWTYNSPYSAITVMSLWITIFKMSFKVITLISLWITMLKKSFKTITVICL